MKKVFNYKNIFLIFLLILLNYSFQVNFLFFHVVSELISFIIGICVVIIVINAYKLSKNSYFVFLAIAFGFTEIFSLLHLLTYKGMNLISGYNANLPSQLWVISRFIESFSILFSFSLIKNKSLKIKPVIIFYSLITLILLYMVLNKTIFPVCFVEGHGVTLFKKVSECVISLFYLINVFLIYKNKKAFIPEVFKYMALSLVFAFISEVFFIDYINLNGIPNRIGHLFFVVSSWYLYKAVIETSIKKPFDTLFNEIKDSNSLLKKQAERERVLRSITQAITSSLDVSQIKQNIVKETGKVFNADRCLIRIWKDVTSTCLKLEDSCEYLKSKDIQSIAELELSQEYQKYLASIFNNDGIVYAPDIDSLPEEQEAIKFLKNYNVKSTYACPIYVDDLFIGFIIVQFTENKVFLEDKDIEFLKSISMQGGIVIKQAKLYSKIKKQAEGEILLRKVTERIRDTFDPDEIKSKLVVKVGKAFNADKCFFWDFDKEKNEFSQELKFDYVTSPDLKKPYTYGKETDNFLIETYRKQGYIYVKDFSELVNEPGHMGVISRRQTEYHKMKTNCCFGLFDGEEFLGAFAVQYKEVTELAEEDIEILQIIVNQVSIALKQSKLYFKIKKQAEREELIRGIIDTVRSTLDPEEMKQLLVKEVGKAFNADKCFIKPIDQEKNTFLPLTAEYFSFPELKKIYDLGEEANFYAVQRYKIGNCFETPDLEALKADPDLMVSSIAHTLVDVYNIKTNYCYPMFYQKELLGALAIQYVNKTVLCEEDLELLKIIVNQTALALKQAELYIQAQQSAKFKSEFIASMSHEFRTPLNAIIGFTDMILTGVYGEMPEKVNQYLNNVTKSGRHLLSLVNDLLDISKIEAGKIELSYRKFNSSLAIQEVVTGLNSLAIQKNISVTLDLCDSLINADEIRFRQIIYNLLSNAIKFTPEKGKVLIKSGINENSLIVLVEDTGIGIAKEDYDKVFEQFEQIDSSFVKCQGGTGLGLALTKKLIELQEGSIYFDSTVHQGSRFWFTLPLALKQDESHCLQENVLNK